MENKSQMDSYLEEIHNNLVEANQVRKVDDIGVATEKHFAALVLLVKKIIYKAVKWMIVPNQNRQTHYNGKIVNAVDLTRNYLQQNQNSMEVLERRLAEQFEFQQEQNRILSQLENQFEGHRKRTLLLEKKVSLLKKENNELRGLLKELTESGAQKDDINALLEKINTLIEEINSGKVTVSHLKEQLQRVVTEKNYIEEKLNICCDLDLLKDSQFDYFAFENKMRGDRAIIKESQRPYVSYFKVNGGGVILDLGSGRGEFLELMYDYGIYAKGTDVYEPFVEYCRKRGFEVEHSDALTYLSKYEDASVGGIFMGQVVEHISNDYLIALVYMAYKKLKPGCYFILETPNGESLSTYRNFYLDPGHSTPVHYLYLKEIFQQAGFENIERYNNPFADYPAKLEELQGENIDNLEEFNAGIRATNELVFGCRDYTLIARK